MAYLRYSVKDTASEKDIDHFYFSIKQFLEILSHCLNWGQSKILDNPEISLAFNILLYEAAFKNLDKLLPENLPGSGVKQLKVYIDYLLQKLPTYPESSAIVIERIISGQYEDSDLEFLKRLITSDSQDELSIQVGKYNVHVGQGRNIHIGDRTYVSWSDEAIQALVQAIRADQADTSKSNALRPQELCRDRPALDQYLTGTLNRLKQQGCLDIQQNVTSGSQYFNYVARISDFELPFGPLSTRGEATFLFSEFASITMPILQQFSGECLQWARGQINPKAAGQAFYNFRVPTHLCFAIALVDQLDAETKAAIQTTNPIDRRVDILWYEVPVVYGLSDKQLYFYSEPANFFDHFKGEIAWKQIRTAVQQLLLPSSD